MQKITSYIILELFILISLTSFGQISKDSIINAQYKESYQLALKNQYAEKAEKLNLSRIETNLDSISLRLWTNGMFGHTLSILSRNNKKWESKKYSFTSSYELKEESFKSTISIPTLLIGLKFFDFSKQISQYEIPGFYDYSDDGVTYILEIAMKDLYRILIYHNPNHFAKNEINNKVFSDVIKLLDKHFLIN